MKRSNSIFAPVAFALSLALAACSGDAVESNVDQASQPSKAQENASEAKDNGYGYEFLEMRLAQNQATPPSSNGKIPADRIAPEEVVKRVQADLPALRACYADALKRDPSLHGKVTVSFRVDTAGAVLESKVKDSSVNDATLGTCMADEIKKLSFPASPGGIMQAYYPFELSPEDMQPAK
jgi:hypothetical protein